MKDMVWQEKMGKISKEAKREYNQKYYQAHLGKQY